MITLFLFKSKITETNLCFNYYTQLLISSEYFQIENKRYVEKELQNQNVEMPVKIVEYAKRALKNIN